MPLNRNLLTVIITEFSAGLIVLNKEKILSMMFSNSASVYMILLCLQGLTTRSLQWDILSTADLMTDVITDAGQT